MLTHHKYYNMRSRKPIIVVSFLFTWTFVTFYLLLRYNTDFNYQNRHVLQKLDILEVGIQQETDTQDKLLKNLISILKTKSAKVPSTDGQSLEYVGNTAPLTESQLEQGADSEVAVHQPQPMPDSHNAAINGPVIPVLVFACNRISVSKCLDNLVQYRPSIEQFPIIVSQDCGDEATKKVILSYKDQVTLISQPDLSDIPVPPKEKKFKGYYKIARHYGWALNTTFKQGYEYVIIVEDDLNVAPDFFEYFLGTHPLLKKDPSLWCISAWNDNGKEGLIDPSGSDILYRTDFFPGLGWMLSKELWDELSPKWPKSFWDDWIRQPQQRRNRACIRPEISRTRTFGKVGVSNGLFFDKHLKYIKLSEEYVHFSKMNLSYLLQDNYDNTFLKQVYQYPVVTYEEVRRGLVTTKGPIRIQYNVKEQYRRTAKMLGLMDDFKSGVPRTGYHGIVSFFYNNQRIYLAPNVNWKGYELTLS